MSILNGKIISKKYNNRQVLYEAIGSVDGSARRMAARRPCEAVHHSHC